MIKPIDVLPQGTFKQKAFVEYIDKPGGLKTIETRVYPKTLNSRKLCKKRFVLQVSIRDLAKALKVRPSVVSKLESGALALIEADWAKVFRTIKEIHNWQK